MIRRLISTDIPQVAKIHAQELSGFLSGLGEEFLRKFYKASLTIPEMFTYVAKENEQVLGFVSGIISTQGLYKRIIYKDIFGFGLLFLRYFITHPEKIVKMAKILTYPGFSSDSPELLVIAVDSKYQRRGVGGRLFHKIVTEFDKRSISKFKISVYAKLSANKFYQKLGCRRISTFPFLGEKMNYYVYRSKNSKSRLILLNYDSLYANQIFLPLLDKSFLEIAAVVVSDCILYKKRKWESLLFFWKKHGWKYFAFKAIDQVIYNVTGGVFRPADSSTRLLWEAEKRKIPIVKMKDINNPESLNKLRQYQPDIIISYFNQILKRDVLTLPAIGCLNVHPGYLPLYRGVASSFWAMEKGSKFGGVTVHYMIEKLDSGDILERGKVPIKRGMSLHQHNYLCCRLGGKLLSLALYKIYQGRVKGVKQSRGNYYSWPKAKEVERFLGKGYKLMQLRDLGLYLR